MWFPFNIFLNPLKTGIHYLYFLNSRSFLLHSEHKMCLYNIYIYIYIYIPPPTRYFSYLLQKLFWTTYFDKFEQT